MLTPEELEAVRQTCTGAVVTNWASPELTRVCFSEWVPALLDHIAELQAENLDLIENADAVFVARALEASEEASSIGLELMDAEAKIIAMRVVLRSLEQWDMLSLDEDGRGVATADAPWARTLIARALSL